MSKSRKVLTAYQKSRSGQMFYKGHRAPDRDFYEAQLQRMAEKEEAQLVNEKAVLGLFLLLYWQTEISDESNMIGYLGGLLRNMSGWIGDRAHNDDESSGSLLCQVLSDVEFILPVKEEKVTVAALANSCTTSYSRGDFIAFAKESVHETFQEMQTEIIIVNGKAVSFFNHSEQALINQYSLSPTIEV